jgi:uncharacterized membrane protein
MSPRLKKDRKRMMQTDVNSSLDVRTQLEPPHVTSGGPGSGVSPVVYAAAFAAAYLLRRQIFRPRTLLFVAGFLTARKLKTDSVPRYLQGLVQEQATMTMNKPADELYKLWQDVESAPRFMESIQTVTRTGKKTSHWVMDLPGGRTLEWDSELTAQEEGRRLAWRTIGDPAVPSAGQVVFEPAVSGRGTVVRLNQDFLIPGGKIAAALGGLFSRTPGGFVRENLRHFKQLAEAGEIATTRGQSHGSRTTGARIQQAVTGDREQQPTVPQTGTIAHDVTPQEVA